MSNKNPKEISKLWKNAVDWSCHDGPHTYNGIHADTYINMYYGETCIYRIKLASCTENFRQVAGENLPPRRKGPPVMGSASRSGWQSVGSVIVVGNRDAILGQNSLQQLSAFQVKV